MLQSRNVGTFFVWFCCLNGLFVHVFDFINDEHHHTVTMTIASLTPMLS